MWAFREVFWDFSCKWSHVNGSQTFFFSPLSKLPPSAPWDGHWHAPGLYCVGEPQPDGTDAWNAPAHFFGCGGEIALLWVHIGCLTFSVVTEPVTKVWGELPCPFAHPWEGTKLTLWSTFKTKPLCSLWCPRSPVLCVWSHDCWGVTGKYAVCLKIHWNRNLLSELHVRYDMWWPGAFSANYHFSNYLHPWTAGKSNNASFVLFCSPPTHTQVLHILLLAAGGLGRRNQAFTVGLLPLFICWWHLLHGPNRTIITPLIH